MAKKMSKWRFNRIQGNKAHPIGVVEADDAEEVIEAAITKYDIAERDQSRLAAMPNE